MWNDPRGNYDMMDGGGAFMGVAVLVLVLLVLTLIAVVANLYFHVNRPGGATAPVAPVAPTESEARRLLDRRLASGEISAEEYAAIRAALEG